MQSEVEFRKNNNLHRARTTEYAYGGVTHNQVLSISSEPLSPQMKIQNLNTFSHKKQLLHSDKRHTSLYFFNISLSSLNGGLGHLNGSLLYEAPCVHAGFMWCRQPILTQAFMVDSTVWGIEFVKCHCTFMPKK